MRLPFVQYMDSWARTATPLAAILVTALVSVVPAGIPDYATLAPAFVLMAVFYWTVHRPDLLRPWQVFLIGLLHDILAGGPLGVNSLVLLFAYWAIVAQHKVFRGKSFGLVWCAFALVAAGAELLVMIAALVTGYGLINPAAALVQYALTIALYPPVAFLMGRAQRSLLPAT